MATPVIRYAIMERKGSGMGNKLCPVDKKACIRDRCMVFDEEREKCGWALSGAGTAPIEDMKKPAERKKEKKKSTAAPSSHYRVHLFD